MSASASLAIPAVEDRRRHRAMKWLARRPAAIIASLVIALFVAGALGAPWLAPFNPNAPHFDAIRRPPSDVYWLGTDEVGRDVLSRLIWGGRASLLAGVIPVAIALTLSIPLGLLSGYAGGWVDGVIMRVNDAMLAIPFLIVAIALAAFLGPSLTNAMIAIGIAALPIFLRLSRGTVLVIRTEDFIEAARALGCSRRRVAADAIIPQSSMASDWD